MKCHLRGMLADPPLLRAMFALSPYSLASWLSSKLSYTRCPSISNRPAGSQGLEDKARTEALNVEREERARGSRTRQEIVHPGQREANKQMSEHGCRGRTCSAGLCVRQYARSS
jgi:hypothetical protein